MRYLHACTLFALAALTLLATAPVRAVEPDEMLSNPKLEARAQALSKELRCLVCQNELIDELQAPLAHDLRVLVRQRLVAGDSDRQIINFLVSRYGEFVLLKPPLSWNTLALWGAPPVVLLIGIGMIVMVERRRGVARPKAAPGSLTAAEQARLTEILGGEAGS